MFNLYLVAEWHWQYLRLTLTLVAGRCWRHLRVTDCFVAERRLTITPTFMTALAAFQVNSLPLWWDGVGGI